MSGVAQAKQVLRDRMKRLLLSLDDDAIKSRSLGVCERIGEALLSRGARAIMIYAPMKHEADVTPLAGAWLMAHWADRARMSSRPESEKFGALCVPRMNWADRSMEPAAVADWDHDLVLNRLGLREPRDDVRTLPIGELDAVIVPGLAFDRRGGRLGRGAGFYDRFLSRLSSATLTIGACLREQVVDDVPMEPTDVRVAMVVSD